MREYVKFDKWGYMSQADVILNCSMNTMKPFNSEIFYNAQADAMFNMSFMILTIMVILYLIVLVVKRLNKKGVKNGQKNETGEKS